MLLYSCSSVFRNSHTLLFSWLFCSMLKRVHVSDIPKILHVCIHRKCIKWCHILKLMREMPWLRTLFMEYKLSWVNAAWQRLKNSEYFCMCIVNSHSDWKGYKAISKLYREPVAMIQNKIKMYKNFHTGEIVGKCCCKPKTSPCPAQKMCCEAINTSNCSNNHHSCQTCVIMKVCFHVRTGWAE